MTAPLRTRAVLGSIALIVATAVVADDRGPPAEARAQIDHDDEYVYRLPYGDSVSFTVLQAYGSELSHTGNAPHLHFGVYRSDAGGEERSIATRFAVRGGLVGALRVGARYTNRSNESRRHDR